MRAIREVRTVRKGFAILLAVLLVLTSVSFAAADETAYRVVMDDAAGLMDSAVPVEAMIGVWEV